MTVKTLTWFRGQSDNGDKKKKKQKNTAPNLPLSFLPQDFSEL